MHALVMHCHLVENNPRFGVLCFSYTEHCWTLKWAIRDMKFSVQSLKYYIVTAHAHFSAEYILQLEAAFADGVLCSVNTPDHEIPSPS